MAAFEAGLAAISAAASAATSGAIAAGNVALANRRQYKNWLKQHDVQLADWRLQNEYNSPVNARQRLVDAGINPNLIAADSGNAGSVSSPGQIPFERPDFSGLFGMFDKAADYYFQGEANRRANELVNQQINESKARENNYVELADLNAAKTAWEILREEGYRSNDLFGKKARKMEAEISYALSRKAVTDLNHQFLKKTFDSRVLYESLKNSLVRSQIGVNKANTGYLGQRSRESKAHEYLLGRHAEHWDIQNGIDALLAPQRYEAGLLEPEIAKNKSRQLWWNADYYRARSGYTDISADYIPTLMYLKGLEAFGRFNHNVNPYNYIYHYFNPKSNGWIR